MTTKYDSPRHREAKRRCAKLVASGKAMCMETICLEERDGRTRWIAPGTPWDTAHTDDGLDYKGPAHRRCNRSDGAVRGNRMRTKRAKPVARRRAL